VVSLVAIATTALANSASDGAFGSCIGAGADPDETPKPNVLLPELNLSAQVGAAAAAAAEAANDLYNCIGSPMLTSAVKALVDDLVLAEQRETTTPEAFMRRKPAQVSPKKAPCPEGPLRLRESAAPAK
jgi:hypothetical protein